MIKKIAVWLLWQCDTWSTILSSKLVQWTGKSDHPIHPKHFLNTAWQHWYLPAIGRTDVVLDVGCNNGMHSIACAKQCRAVYGFDRSARQLAIAQAKAAEAGLHNTQFSEGNVEGHWIYADGQFDKVIFLDVIEHLYQRDHALRETARVLKPGGVLLLSAPQRGTSWKRLRASVHLFAYADPDHKIEYTRAELEEELTRNGFVIETVEPTVLDTPVAGWIDLLGGISLDLYRRLAEWKRAAALRHPEESTGFRIIARKGALP